MSNSDKSHAGLMTALQVLRRRARLIVLCAIIVPISSFFFSVSQEKQYTTSASLLFRDPQLDQKLFGSAYLAPSIDPNRAAATNVQLVSLDEVADRTQRLIPRAGKVKDKVEVAAEGQSDVVRVTATDPDPEKSARIANVFAEQYIDFRRQADRAKIADAQALVRTQFDRLNEVERAGSRGRSLRDRAEQLQVLASLQTGNAELVERAKVPGSSSSPKVTRNTILGAVFGLMLGAGLAFLLERLDRRVRDPKEMQDIFDRPILGAIPESRALTASGRASEHEVEAFRMLRANLRYFNIDRDVKSVLVTSAAPGDGKTTVAWNLASAAASSGSRVLAVEADLRHPRFASAIGVFPQSGLSAVLAGQVEFDDAIQQVPVGEGANGRAPRTIDVLFAGPLPPNPTDLLESERMHEVIERAEREYDFVVIDTPPTSVVSDAIPLVGRVGGVIVVGRLGKSTREGVTRLRNQLQNLNSPTLGVVVNALGAGDSEAYGYGYGYGYAAEPERVPAPRGRG